ncbi:Methyl-accepting chemotaxis protein signaling domain protein (modular protein) [Treponema phagedenis]|uniref:Methyl-accepting chemotaxis protein signaling domain protein (Modular protein) n=1 Tax=Treponema phagedenis TaxID=162 RepID=A0A0B7GT24_TREPH|nr:methyl-accepting chemotaxis protein [Treponema phagedenis]CEM61794.1 Methyl-accepting chemotaxis protein signaling domain protein (modular protein) [Treponema phagedenis]
MAEKEIISSQNKKIFSIRKKLIFIFSVIIMTLGLLQTALESYIIRTAIEEEAIVYLQDRAVDLAELISIRIHTLSRFVEYVAMSPEMKDPKTSPEAKTTFLQQEMKYQPLLMTLDFVDVNGIRYLPSGGTINISDRSWIQTALKGKLSISEPVKSRTGKGIAITISVPVYDNAANSIGVILAAIPAKTLSKIIDDILIGETGDCYILGKTGTTIAEKDFSLVENFENSIEQAKTDPSVRDMADFEKRAIESDDPIIGYYTWDGDEYISASAKIANTGWTIFPNLTTYELFSAISSLRRNLFVIGLIGFLIGAVITAITAQSITKPLNQTVRILQDISEGAGDLTTTLPAIGGEEIANLSRYFNLTIAKIRSSIIIVSDTASTLQKVAEDLSSNMNHTSDTVNKIGIDVDGIKTQVISQASSVTQTASSLEQMRRAIESLHINIETQSANVSESSSAIEEMVANVHSVNSILVENAKRIAKLQEKSVQVKDNASKSAILMQEISVQSDGLLDATNVIQHIASQTNLLAMNAAIEAAHAGDAGKGFAVVADEIRKLAEESSAQGKQISTVLKNLKANIDEVANDEDKAQKLCEETYNLTTEVKQQEDIIMNAMQEQTAGSGAVLQSMTDINEITVEVKAGASEMMTGSTEVTKEMQKLTEISALMTDSMDEMTAGAIQIGKAIDEVNEITQQTKNNIEILVTEVDKFKIM